MKGKQKATTKETVHAAGSDSILSRAAADFTRGDLRACEVACRAVLRDQPEQPQALLLLGNSLGRQGRADEALGHLQTAAGLMPENPDVHYALAMALTELRRWSDAETAYRQVLTRSPRYAYAYNNLGVVLREGGSLAVAIACFREALAIDPAFLDARTNLSRSLLEANRPADALPHFEAIREAGANQAAFGMLHAQALRQMGRSDDAITLLSELAKRNPGQTNLIYALGQAQRDAGRIENAIETWTGAAAEGLAKARLDSASGTALVELGKIEAAIAAFRSALAADPSHVGAWLALTGIKDFSPDDQDIEAMERCAQSPGLPEQERAKVLFALGRALERAEVYDRAFTFFEAANAVMRARRGSEIHAVLATHGAMRQRFRTIAEPLPTNFSEDAAPKPIFVVGMPRSGTTLVEQILASHPEIHGAGELQLLNDATLEIIPNYPEGLESLGPEGLEAIATRYRRGLTELAKGARYATDKMPVNYEKLGLIAEAFPSAPIIHLRRNPLDTCVSCFTTLFDKGQRFSYDLKELGRYYRLYEDMMAHWRAVLPSGRILDVIYEDLVAEPEAQVRRLLTHCALDWSDDCLHFYQNKRPVLTASASEVRQPLYSSSIGRWRRFETQLQPLITALAE